MTQRELLMIGADEAKHENRATITDKIAKLSSSLVSRLGRRDGAGLMVRFLCADACSLISGRVWSVTGSQEM